MIAAGWRPPVARQRSWPAAVEVFAGAGLFSLALHVEGFEEVDSVEWSPSSVATRRRNASVLGLRRVPNPADARTWEPALVAVDALVGGPPCNPFSGAARLSRDADARGWRAEDNHFPLALDWICDLGPRVVAFENARELSTNADNRRWLDGWRAQLGALGYASAVHMLAAADYGSPQARVRTWVFAWRADDVRAGRVLAEPPPTTHGRPGTWGVGQGGKLPWTRMFDRLVSGCCQGYYLVDCANLGNAGYACRGCIDARNFRAAPNTTGETGERRVPESVGGRPYVDYMLEPMSKLRPDQVRIFKFTPADKAGAWAWKDLEPSARAVTWYLARTVVPRFTRYSEGLAVPPGLQDFGKVGPGSPRKVVEKLIRGLQVMSARDAAKLQDVPAWYAFEGARDAVFQQIGMGIPVNMGRAVARHLRVALGLPVLQQPSRAPEGYWPLDRADPCAGFFGLVEGAGMYGEDELAEEAAMQAHMGIGEEPLSQAQRHARPFPRPQDFAAPAQVALQRRRARAGQVQRFLFDSGYGALLVDPRALADTGWLPERPFDVPIADLEPDAEGLEVLWGRMPNEGPGSMHVNPAVAAGGRNHWGLVYRSRFPATDYRQVWPLEPARGLPAWSTFTQRDLDGVLRREGRARSRRGGS